MLEREEVEPTVCPAAEEVVDHEEEAEGGEVVRAGRVVEQTPDRLQVGKVMVTLFIEMLIIVVVIIVVVIMVVVIMVVLIIVVVIMVVLIMVVLIMVVLIIVMLIMVVVIMVVLIMVLHIIVMVIKDVRVHPGGTCSGVWNQMAPSTWYSPSLQYIWIGLSVGSLP